jgi:hypothetical protein
VFHARVGIDSGARDVSQRVDDYRSNVWIGRYQANPLVSKVEGTAQEFFVGGH